MIAVITALIGLAESAPPIGVIEDGVRYACFTDREAPGWECLKPPSGHPPRYVARWIKTHVHKLVDVNASIWIDASFDLLVSPSKIVLAAQSTGCDIVGFKHPDRSNIHDEAAVIVDNRMAGTEAIAQVMRYAAVGFKKTTLTTTGLLVRRHTDEVAAFNDYWWREQSTNTLRDQLSVDYAAWRCDLNIGYLPGHYRDNRFAHYNRVRHRQGR